MFVQVMPRAAVQVAKATIAALDEASSDDGVEVVFAMLENERPAVAPLPTPDVERLVADFATTEWGLQCTEVKKREREVEQISEREWEFWEDCAVADIMTGVCPDGQEREVEKRLRRSWNEVVNRFRLICGRVGGGRKWESRRVKKDKEKNRGKVECPIAKRCSKWR